MTQNNHFQEITQIIKERSNQIDEIDFSKKYEEAFCTVTGFKLASKKEQHKFDCSYISGNGNANVKIELKKGNRWLNLARYINKYDKNHITLFILLNSKRDRVNAIYGYITNEIAKNILGITDKQIKLIKGLNKQHQNKLNIQCPITMAKLSELEPIIKYENEKYAEYRKNRG